ncbi:MAG TPA: CoA transferase, partial [Acidimicrobiia bacterium]
HRVDIAAARQTNPGLIVVSISPFGATGPYADRTASDPVLLAMSGILHRARPPGGGPLLPPGRMASEAAGAMAVYLALVSVWRRATTGVGDHVELSALENLIQCSDTALVGEGAALSSTDLLPRITYPSYRAKDGFVKPILTGSRHWHAVRRWFGDPDELQDEALDTPQGRAAAAELISRHYERLFATMTAEEASEEGQRRGVPIAPVWSPSAVLASEGMRRRGTFAEVDVDGVQGLVPSGFLYLDGAKVGPRRSMPSPAQEVDDAVSALRSPFAPELGDRRRATVGGDGGGDGDGPLRGLRVLLFGVLMAGPEIAKLLSDQGAEVIRVESSRHPDAGRVFGGAAGMSTQFVSMNRNARSFGVDAKTDEGRRIVLDLVADADVLVENLGPGALDGIGLTRDALRTANPRLVRIGTQLFGDDCPWGHWRGFGNHARGMGAMTWLWRDPSDETGFADDNVFFPDQFIGRVGATAVLASLLCGRGRDILLSQADAVLNFMPEVTLAESIHPGSVQPLGCRSPDHAPGGIFACEGDDQWCVVTVADDEEWKRLVEAVQEPWAEDPRFRQVVGRVGAADELHELLEAWTSGRSPEEVTATLQRHGVPAAPVVPTVALLDDPHLIARDFLRLQIQPGFDPLFLEGDSWRSEQLRQSPLRAAPSLGQDTMVIATELLGLSPAEVDRLLRAEILEHTEPPVD